MEMSIIKKIIIKKGVCRLKFVVTDTLVDHPKEAAVVGDFNNWDPRRGKMQKSKTGYFEKTIELPLGRDYQFRYLINKCHWENDWQADAYIPTPYGEDDNMILSCTLPQTKMIKNHRNKIRN